MAKRRARPDPKRLDPNLIESDPYVAVEYAKKFGLEVDDFRMLSEAVTATTYLVSVDDLKRRIADGEPPPPLQRMLRDAGRLLIAALALLGLAFAVLLIQQQLTGRTPVLSERQVLTGLGLLVLLPLLAVTPLPTLVRRWRGRHGRPLPAPPTDLSSFRES